MDYDLWFARHGQDLYVVAAPAGEAPQNKPMRVTSLSAAMQSVTRRGHNITQVGICDYDMIRII